MLWGFRPSAERIKHATGAAILAAAAISRRHLEASGAGHRRPQQEAGEICAGCASAPATAPPVRLDFPAPDTGPGRPDLSRADQEHIDKGWKALLKGDAASARAKRLPGRRQPGRRALIAASCVGGRQRQPGIRSRKDDDGRVGVRSGVAHPVGRGGERRR